jgi:hypothetical protein
VDNLLPTQSTVEKEVPARSEVIDQVEVLPKIRADFPRLFNQVIFTYVQTYIPKEDWLKKIDRSITTSSPSHPALLDQEQFGENNYFFTEVPRKYCYTWRDCVPSSKREEYTIGRLGVLAESYNLDSFLSEIEISTAGGRLIGVNLRPLPIQTTPEGELILVEEEEDQEEEENLQEGPYRTTDSVTEKKLLRKKFNIIQKKKRERKEAILRRKLSKIYSDLINQKVNC